MAVRLQLLVTSNSSSGCDRIKFVTQPSQLQWRLVIWPCCSTCLQWNQELTFRCLQGNFVQRALGIVKRLFSEDEELEAPIEDA